VTLFCGSSQNTGGAKEIVIDFDGVGYMKRRNVVLSSALGLIVLVVLAMALGGSLPVSFAGRVLNSFRSRNNPAGTLVGETRGSVTIATDAPLSGPNAEPIDAGSWPSYNRTLTSQRYSPLSQINKQTVHGLKVLCTYDTHLRENYETGPLMIDGALIFTTALDIFAIDPATCRENWHTHEDYKSVTPLLVNRGAAYLDGRLFRGTLDGRVLAYDFKTGKRLWATAIADPGKIELVDAAPIAWNGLVFIGVAMGDTKGVKGRVYALAADDGHIVWETYMVPKVPSDLTRGPQGLMPAAAITTWQNTPDVPINGGGSWTSYTLDPVTSRLYVPVGNPSPDFVESVREGDDLFTGSVVTLDAKTGNYISHFQIAPRDWHDWDASNAPALITTRGGRQLLSFAPKNGYLYGVDLPTNQLLYRNPVTRIENAEAPLSTDKETYFCPGAVGGGEWNGVAYDPQTNLVLTGEDEWCTAVRLKTAAQVKAIANGTPWMGAATANPLDIMGKQDPHSAWAGWLYATDADSGEWKWRLKSSYPILSGVTPTGGGLVFFGDMGGNLYAVDASNGQRLWGQKLPGAIGGGVITYTVNGSQKVAVAAGLNSILWPTEQATSKMVVLGLSDASQ
jgi:alcohol dehydrogenase (cytochrome c)